MRSPRLPGERGRLADLDRTGRTRLSLPVHHHLQAPQRRAAIQHSGQGLEERGEVAATDFSFKNTTDAKKVDLKDLDEGDDLPSHFATGEAK
jgi:hypothetical protein